MVLPLSNVVFGVLYWLLVVVGIAVLIAAGVILVGSMSGLGGSLRSLFAAMLRVVVASIGWLLLLPLTGLVRLRC